MGVKQDSAGSKGDGEPVEVFRQFAWHLAGSLAVAQAARTGATHPVAKARPGKGAAKR